MSKAKSRPAAQRAKPWWSKRKNRNRVWLSLLISLAVVAVGGFMWLATQGSGGMNEPSIGQQVNAFELPDVVSGQTFSLADYLGKRDIVLVSYMGFFCTGCEELLDELQGRQADFEQRDAKLVVLGSRPESLDLAKSEAQRRNLTYPLLYDANTSVTQELGMWSDGMEMPWMGYMIIDRSGKVAGSDLMLSEATGAGPENVDTILAALDRAQQAEASGA
ncbi:MAG: redoxin domain-containing protein [Chloroflexi bacterium]|nr:redoxin domain-containing protein [Chloroflexota bacterium]